MQAYMQDVGRVLRPVHVARRVRAVGARRGRDLADQGAGRERGRRLEADDLGQRLVGRLERIDAAPPNVAMGVVGILVPLSVQDGRAERRLREQLVDARVVGRRVRVAGGPLALGQDLERGRVQLLAGQRPLRARAVERLDGADAAGAVIQVASSSAARV
jgi:hypothetical protein